TGESPDYKVEQRWEWILDKAFLQLKGKDTYGEWIDILGIDPMTGKWANWGMDEKGRVWKGASEIEKPGTFSSKIKGQGPAGVMIWNSRNTKLGDDSVRTELLEIVSDGKKEQPTTLTLTRKK